MPKRPREESASVPSGQPSRKAPRLDRSALPWKPSLARRVPVSAEGNTVAAADEGGRVRIFSFDDGADGSCKLEFKAGTKAVVDLAFLGGGVVAGVFENGKVRTWLAATGDEVERIKLGEGCSTIEKVDDRTFVVGKEGGQLVFVSHSVGRDFYIIYQLSIGHHCILSICVSGELVVANSLPVVVGVWKAMQYKKVTALLGKKTDELSRSQAVAVNKGHVVATSLNRTRIYDLNSKRNRRQIPDFRKALGNSKSVCFVGKDLLLISSLNMSNQAVFRFWKPSTFREIAVFHTSVFFHESYSLALTVDGRIACVEFGATRAVKLTPPKLLASAVQAYAERLHSPQTAVPLPTFQAHVNHKPCSRANVKIEPIGRDDVPPVKVEDDAQAPDQPYHSSLNLAKQEPGSEPSVERKPVEIYCIDLEDEVRDDLKSLKASSCQPSLLEAMSVDAICDVLAGVMISFEESFQDHVPLLSGCLRRVLRQNFIAADSIVHFPEAMLFAMIQTSLAKDEAYGKLSQNVSDNFEWRLQRFLLNLRL